MRYRAPPLSVKGCDRGFLEILDRIAPAQGELACAQPEAAREAAAAISQALRESELCYATLPEVAKAPRAAQAAAAPAAAPPPARAGLIEF